MYYKESYKNNFKADLPGKGCFNTAYLKLFLFAFTLLGVTYNSSAQSIPVFPAKPNVVAPKTKIAKPGSTRPKSSMGYYFFDDFSDNKNKWSLSNDADLKKIEISKGKLIVTGISRQFSYETLKQFNIDLRKDFSFSMVVKWLDGGIGIRFGLAFCANATSYNYFTISSSGDYEISYFDNDAWKYLKPLSVSEYINKGTVPNILLIKKNGNYISFYINDNKLDTFPFDGGFGNSFGVWLERKQTVEFDNCELIGTKKVYN